MSWLKWFKAVILALAAFIKSLNATSEKQTKKKESEIEKLEAEFEQAKEKHKAAVMAGNNGERLKWDAVCKRLSTEIYNLRNGQD